MAPLPNFDDLRTKLGNDNEYWFIVCLHYTTIAIFTFLALQVVSNIWLYMIRQERWKTFPILILFYTMAFITIYSRYIQLFISAKQTPFQVFLGKVAIVSKLGVGVAQMWMMFTLALRIKGLNANDKIILWGQRTVSSVVGLLFTGFFFYAIYILANSEKWTAKMSYNFYFTSGCFFLVIFLMMAAVNTYLIHQMNKKNQVLNHGDGTNIFGDEKRKILLILLLFELTYLARFIWDGFFVQNLKDNNEYF